MINKKKMIISALVLTMCTTAALASCGTNNTSGSGAGDSNGERVTDSADKDQKEPNGNAMNGIESGVEGIGSDIKDSFTHPEDATHGTDDGNTDNTENGGTTGNTGGANSENAGEQANSARHRRIPYGK